MKKLFGLLGLLGVFIFIHIPLAILVLIFVAIFSYPFIKNKKRK